LSRSISVNIEVKFGFFVSFLNTISPLTLTTVRVNGEIVSADFYA